jgi:hypothetical protein
VEIADLLTHDAIRVRDSKNPSGPKLTFSRLEFQVFAAEAKAGKHDI